MDYAPIKAMLAKKVSEALRVLLSEKHLYQSVMVDLGFLDEVAAAQHAEAVKLAATPRFGGGGIPNIQIPPLGKFREELNGLPLSSWFPSGAPPMVQTEVDILHVNDLKTQKYPLPTIKVTCNHCDERGPFNPVGALVETSRDSFFNQWTYLSYECQNCKSEPVRFLVRRTELKLTLSGRDPFETVEIPSFIPKHHAKNFRNALIANHAGQTLAGIFLMRVFVEQFWKSIPKVVSAVKGNPRPTGDELGEAYKATLPKEFKERFPTLAEVYDSLSEAMHSASEDAQIFAKCHEQIIEHFDARRVFKFHLEKSSNKKNRLLRRNASEKAPPPKP